MNQLVLAVLTSLSIVLSWGSATAAPGAPSSCDDPAYLARAEQWCRDTKRLDLDCGPAYTPNYWCSEWRATRKCRTSWFQGVVSCKATNLDCSLPVCDDRVCKNESNTGPCDCVELHKPSLTPKPIDPLPKTECHHPEKIRECRLCCRSHKTCDAGSGSAGIPGT